MGEPLLTSSSMESHHLSTLLSMDPSGAPPPHTSPPHDDSAVVVAGNGNRDCLFHRLQTILSPPPDINLPLSSSDRSSPPPRNSAMLDEFFDVTFSAHAAATAPAAPPPPHETDAHANPPKHSHRKCSRRGDTIWGAWFFFNFYFKPAIPDSSPKGKTANSNPNGAGNSVEKSDLRLDVFLVQHDMENLYMWVFKEKPENALGKMQLRSYMNGHSRPGEPQFPFSADKGFVRSHRMQRKQYRGLSNPQCVHGIEVVASPNLSTLSELDLKKWVELTGRNVNFSIPSEASDYESWRNISAIVEFDMVDRPVPAPSKDQHTNHRKLLNGTGLNLASHGTATANEVVELSTVSNHKRKKDHFFSNCVVDEDGSLPSNSSSEDAEVVHVVEPQWMNEFGGVMRHAQGPVTAAKTIYEDDEGYLILMSLPFVDLQKVKVSWRNTLLHGVVKVQGVSIARMQYVKRHKRTFKLTDPCPEHCPPGEFLREVPLPARIPEDATLEAYCDETGTTLEILVPKHRTGPEEHEVPVCLRPHL